MAASLSLAGFSFPQAGAGGGPDVNGVRWNYTLDGWDGPDMRTERLTKPGVWGAQPGEWVYDPRALVFRGFAYAGSESGMWAAQDNLAKLSDATEQPVTLAVTTPLRTLTMLVRRAGALKMTARTDRAIEFQVPLTALDPRKYSTSSSTWHAGDGDGVMAGTAFRVPVQQVTFTSTSGATDARFRNATDMLILDLAYDHAIAGGETVTVDFATQTASSSTRGDVTSDLALSSVWPDMIRGANAMLIWAVSGDIEGTVTWRDAWI